MCNLFKFAMSLVEGIIFYNRFIVPCLWERVILCSLCRIYLVDFLFQKSFVHGFPKGFEGFVDLEFRCFPFRFFCFSWRGSIVLFLAIYFLFIQKSLIIFSCILFFLEEDYFSVLLQVSSNVLFNEVSLMNLPKDWKALLIQDYIEF